MYKGIPTLVLIVLFLSYSLRAKERKAAPTSPQLYNEIAREDSLMFAAYNAHDINRLKTFFSKELEWFQDNEGLINYDTVFMNFENIFRGNTGLTRRLVKNSLEVHPVKHYGAIETGVHKFSHIEDGKTIEGTFKFLMIWRKQNGNEWQVTKVVSYDH